MEEVEESFISWTAYPQKSINDVNEYRYVMLKNKLRALLISCPKDKNQTWVQAGVVYAAEDGPEFLRTGATSRANNFASEVFFAPRKKKKEKSKENEGSEVEMELEDNTEKELEEKEENEEKEYELKVHPEEDEDADRPDSDASLSDAEFDDMDPEKFIKLIETDDESLNEIFKEVMSEPEVELNLKSLTDVNVLTSQMIPVDLSQIVAKQDEGFQLVFQNKNTPVVLNGDAAITFPVGSLYDPPELNGIFDLSRRVIENVSDKVLSVTSTGFLETMSTFVKQHEQSKDIESSLITLLNALQKPNYKQKDLKDLLCKNYPPSQNKYEIVSKMDSRSWLLNDKKQLQFIYSLAKDAHSFQNVSPGFRQGLMPINEDCKSITEGLEYLWQNQYSKESATVVLQSSESLDTLQQVLVKHFIKKKAVFPDANDENTAVPLEEPFSMTTFAKQYQVCYNGGDSATPSLVISWALDPTLWKNYKSKPLDHVAWLLSHKLERGLHSILHKRGLITDLQAGCNHTGYHRNNWCSLFQINLQLTDKGLNILDRIVPVVMRYINHLEDLNIEAHGQIYQYLKYTQEISFNSNEPEISQLRDMEVPFSHFTNSAPRIGALAEAMQKFPPEDVLMGDILLFEFEHDVIKRVLQSLLPDKCNYMVSQQINDLPWKHEEKYYKTKYIVLDIPNIWVDRKIALNEKLELEILTGFASPNLYYTEYELGPTLPEGENLPWPVLKFSNISVWQKNSHLYKSMVSYMAHIACPLLGNYSPERSVMVSMLVNELNDLVTNGGLDAGNIANLHYSIEPTHFGVLVNVFGHKSLAQNTCETILKTLEVALVSTNPKKHNLLLKRKYNSALARAEVLAKCFLNKLTVRNYVSLYSRLETLKKVNQKSFESFASSFRREREVGVLVAGAADFEAYQISSWFLETDSPFSYPEAMMYIWPVGTRILRVLSNHMEKNQVLVNHQFQMRATLENKCNSRIFHEFIGAMEFKSFRITSQVNEFNGIIHFEISGSALDLSVDNVDKELNKFLENFIEDLDNVPDIFQSWLTTECILLKKQYCLTQSYNHVIDQMQDYERKVKDFSFNFDCHDASAQAAQYSAVSHKTFLKWVEKYFSSDGKEHRKISIQILNDPVKKPKCVLGKRTNSQTTESEDNVNNNCPFRIFTPKNLQSGSKQFIGDVSEFTERLDLYNIVNHRT